ncbi:MAG: UDP-N-acetylglucosamine 1-carboxyvinyltransferase [Alphaproteobacteria bacterium]|nr:UDP-N-acetylglucosamine 1-carboxyvinyltransferase [Alphaproteobacteria bacterium]
MDRIRIKGGRPLSGTIPISGAKNAALPLMAAALLSERPLALAGVPNLADIDTMARLLAELGVEIEIEAEGKGADRGLRLAARDVKSLVAPYDLVRKMRASVLVLGPLLARFGKAKVSLPGGCAIGTRPIDLHLAGLQQLGARIELTDGYVVAAAPKGLVGAEIQIAKVSVGATENLMMAASLARGRTVLDNAAREPEIEDLAECLNAMGARVQGAGGNRIVIDGVERLGGAAHRVLPDRIEAATYALAAAVAGGEVTLRGASALHLGAVLERLQAAGAEIEELPDGLRIARNGTRPRGVDVMTQPFPGFPTDVQAQMMALAAIAEGASMITETVFENRFMHVPELARMGANITVHGASAIVRGVAVLRGAPVMATDLRASVSLVLAGLAAEGETVVNRVYHLDRGYERLEAKLAAAGAEVERLRERG